MKKLAIFFVTLLVLGCFVSAAGANDEGVIISKASVLAKEGEMVQITAVGNPTTGYVWSEPKLSNGLTLVLSDYTQLKPGMIGTGGCLSGGLQQKKQELIRSPPNTNVRGKLNQSVQSK